MFDGLHRYARAVWAGEGRLFEVHCDLLYQCDLDCEHCYLDDKGSRNHPTAFWREVLDQLADMGVFAVHLSGGELFLRPDAFELIAHARSRGLFVHVKTHGGRLDADGAERLAELGVSSVQISYYSHRPEVHDAITRRPGSHAATLGVLRSLAAHDVPAIVACVVMRRNKDDVAGTVAQCESLGIPVRLEKTVRVANSGDGFPRETALSTEELAEIEAFEAEHAGGCSADTGDPGWGERKLCTAGHMALYVDPEGRVTPCVTWPLVLGDLTREPMAAIWERSPELARIRRIRRSDLEVCSRCALRDDCEFCPGHASLDRGDPLRPPEGICEATYARALARARREGRGAPPRPAAWDEPRPPSSAFRILSDAEARAAGP